MKKDMDFGGLLSNPMFMIGTGLLGNQGNQWGGALQGLAAAQGYKLSESKLKKEQEQEARLRELQDMQMEQARKAQERAQTTQATIQAAASQNPGLLQDPAYQSQLRMWAAANADPAMMEQAGLLSPQQDPMKPPSSFVEYQLGQQDPRYAEFLRAQGAQGNAGTYFSGTTVRLPDGTYAQWQPGNRPGMDATVTPLPGEPVTYDTALAQAMAAARAAGTVTGTAAGTREKQAPENDMTMQELDAISTDGGLIDQSTGSGLGAMRDRAAAVVGVSTDGAEAIAKLRPIADRVLKTVPRFEGPQSDKDTQSYRDAAGNLADPTVPPSVRKAAAKEIVRLMRERNGQFVTIDSTPAIVPKSSPSQRNNGSRVVDFNSL